VAAREAAVAQAAAAREAVLDRLQWQLAELRESLDKIAVANAIMAVELKGQPDSASRNKRQRPSSE